MMALIISYPEHCHAIHLCLKRINFIDKLSFNTRLPQYPDMLISVLWPCTDFSEGAAVIHINFQLSLVACYYYVLLVGVCSCWIFTDTDWSDSTPTTNVWSCGELTLAGHQVSTKANLSLTSSAGQGRKVK